MNVEKTTGSYYTPCDLINFMIDYLIGENQCFSSVLEPSAGDGRFLRRLLEEEDRVDAVELFEEKVRDIGEHYDSAKLNVKACNFLDYASDSRKKYSLIIGNPPYVNLKTMDKGDIDKARQLCISEQLDKSIMKNLWVAFVVGACKLLQQNGTVFFVLPMEFLQVQYAEKLREHLENKFNTIHIIAFEEAIFRDIEQHICLVYLTNKSGQKQHIVYKVYQNAMDRLLLGSNLIRKNKPLKKWSNAILFDTEITLLKQKSKIFPKVDTTGEIAPGIVTGGNKYFILTDQQVKKYRCENYVLPIVQKATYVFDNTIEITDSVLSKIKERGKPLYVLDLAQTKEALPKELNEYLEWAGNQQVKNSILKECYKCANRTPWYGVPIVNKGEVIFFKRYDILPRIYVNQANVHTTDAGYHIRLKDEYEADSFVFCFFNSMTLAECEYFGRYYGGGVSELVPSEFKSLTIPYQQISQTDIAELREKFNNCESVERIVEFVNAKTIMNVLSQDEVQMFESIRKKLIKRRVR